MPRLSFYVVDSGYCDFLRLFDSCVPYTMDKKARRPFVGILIEVHGVKYYAPLSSPKPKHIHMKNQVDFIKISGGNYGVINLNNMIPVHDSSISIVNPVVNSYDSKQDVAYKELLTNQLTWCNANRANIIKKATRLYNMVVSGKAHKQLIDRCCDFLLDEKNMEQYIQNQKRDHN